jgi:hypothetical protein
MIQIAINNQPVEQYFKTSENINDFLESAASLDLLSILSDIKADELHQKSLSDIKNKKIAFHDDAKSLVKALND